jgi:hypothetical protein
MTDSLADNCRTWNAACGLCERQYCPDNGGATSFGPTGSFASRSSFSPTM